jgi:post-segregation antitoxin (ccd killing protein)
MPINKNEITKEMVEKALQCKTADELIALAKAKGVDITKAEAEAYMTELADVELDRSELKNIAGGGCYADCQQVCSCDGDCPYNVRGSR